VAATPAATLLVRRAPRWTDEGILCSPTGPSWPPAWTTSGPASTGSPTPTKTWSLSSQTCAAAASASAPCRRPSTPPSAAADGRLTAVAEFGNVLVEGRAADAEQSGDGRDAVLRSG